MKPNPQPAPSATKVFSEYGFPVADHDRFGSTNEFAVYPPRQKEPYLRRIGGGSLTLSLLVHAVLILIAFFLVKIAVDQKKEEVVDFLPGGDGGGKSNQANLASHRKSVSMSLPFDVFNDRRDTFYFEKIGNYAWLALTSNELNDAGAIYWFADFKDPVHKEQLEDMAKTMLKRRQKLYVHASGDDPKSLSMVEEIVVKPTGGQVLKIDINPVKK